ncbi:MAG: oxidoreductase [Desulfitobacteriia bacterium]|jgi:Fe-S-cluster-containing dehydrogenase component
MARTRKGLLIDYEYCTGCHTCEVACKQENNYPPGSWGIKINEIILEHPDRVEINYLPFPTDLCNLCTKRTKEGKVPACVKHCQADCMRYGEVSELVKEMEKKPKTVLFAPK